MKLVVCLILFAACNGKPMCTILDIKQCTEHRECILDLDQGDHKVVCRDAIGCELEVTWLDVKGTPDERVREMTSRCAANPACALEDRGCFCPCNLSGFPLCSCVCGGGLPQRCAPKH